MAAIRATMQGPTKRSADVNDYVSLEADLARCRQELADLRAETAADLRDLHDLALRYREVRAAEAAARGGIVRGRPETTDASVDATTAARVAARALADATARRVLG